MTKPTKSTTSGKTGEKAADKSKTDAETKSDTLKLKKEAATPGTVHSKDTGEGSGADAAAGGGEVKPIESALVGSSKGSAPAAATAKPAEQVSASKTVTKDQSDKPVLTSPPEKSKFADEKQTSVPNTGKAKDIGVNKTDAVEPFKEDKRAANKDAKDVTTRSESAKPGPSVAPAQTMTVQKTGFWRVVSGGVVAAGLGAAAAVWALPHLPAGWLPEAQTQDVAVDAEAIKADAVAAAEQAARNIVEQSAPTAAAPAEDIEAALASQEERIAALETAADEVAAPLNETPPAQAPTENASTPVEPTTPQATQSPATDGPATDGNVQQVVADLQKQLESQATQIEELAARPSLDPQATAKVIALADRVDSVQQQIDAAQEETAKLQTAAQESTKRAEAVAAIASLQAALEKGVTPEDAQKTLEAAGIAAPEALAAEVPSLDSLQTGFGDASRAALRVSRSDGSSGEGNMLTNFLRSQTGARSVEPREGDGPDAILSRANASVESGDIAAALEEMAALPDSAKEAPAMAEWLTGANAYKDAAAALSDLSAPKN